MYKHEANECRKNIKINIAKSFTISILRQCIFYVWLKKDFTYNMTMWIIKSFMNIKRVMITNLIKLVVIIVQPHLITHMKNLK